MRVNYLLLIMVFVFVFVGSYANNPKRDVWEITNYIWDFGLISSCDVGLNKNPKAYFATDASFNTSQYQNLKPGDIVWVKCCFIPQFCKHVLPALKQPVVLLIADGDETFPDECGNDFDVEILLAHEKIIHVFAQNNAYKGTSQKVTGVPIGMDFHTVAYKGQRGGWGEKGSPQEQEAKLNSILNSLKPTYQRKRKAFVEFQHSDTMHGEFQRYLQFGEDRKSIFQKLLPTGLVEHSDWMSRSSMWKKKGEYAFSISPHGNGLDCHRTWEDLVLGCIVIVKTSPLDPLYQGLPVVIIKDWSEITAENMEKWLALYGDSFTNSLYREKLKNRYWFSKLQAKAQPYKS